MFGQLVQTGGGGPCGAIREIDRERAVEWAAPREEKARPQQEKHKLRPVHADKEEEEEAARRRERKDRGAETGVGVVRFGWRLGAPAFPRESKIKTR